MIFSLGVPHMTTAMDLKDIESFSAAGMPAILRSTKDYGDIVAFQLTTKGSVALQPKAGAIELLLKAIHGGTPSYSKEQMDQIFTESGAIFGIEPKNDYVEVSLKCLKRFLPKLLPVISEMIRVPELKPEEIELSREQLMADLKNEQDHPDSILQLISGEAFFKNHPYSRRTSGYLDTVPTITREDLKTTLPKIFNIKNVFLTFIGDLSKEEAQGFAEKYFGNLPPGERASVTTELPQNETKEIVFKKFDSPTTYFSARFKAPALKDSDYPALTLACQILDTRLFEEVRTKRGLTYAVHCSMGNSAVNSGYLYVSSTQLPESVKVIFDEVRKIQTELIDAKTIELQVRKFTSSWYLGREQSSSQARIFALYEMIGTGWQDSNTFIDRLNTATPEKVREVAQKYFKDFTIAVVGPEKSDLTASLGFDLHPHPKKPAAKAKKKK
jgi:zinc protease